MNTILHSAVHEIPLSTLFWMDQLVTGEEASDMFKVWTLEGWSTILKKTQPDSTRGRCKRTCRYPTAVGGPTSCYASISKSEMFNEWDGPNVLAIELISECSQHKKWRVRIRRTKDHTNLTSSSLVYWVRQTYNMESGLKETQWLASQTKWMNRTKWRKWTTNSSMLWQAKSKSTQSTKTNQNNGLLKQNQHPSLLKDPFNVQHSGLRELRL